MPDRVRIERENLDWLLNESHAAFEAWNDETAHNIEAQTKINIVQNDQVDTGAMLNSVAVIDGELPASKQIIVGVDYGLYQEMGTVFQPARPFLGPAVEMFREPYLEGVLFIVQNARRP